MHGNLHSLDERESEDCEFQDQVNERILEHLIQTIEDNDLIKKYIQKRWNLDQFIEEVSQREDISQQVKDTNDDHTETKEATREAVED